MPHQGRADALVLLRRVHRHRVQPAAMPVVPRQRSAHNRTRVQRHEEQPIPRRQFLVDHQRRRVVPRRVAQHIAPELDDLRAVDVVLVWVDLQHAKNYNVSRHLLSFHRLDGSAVTVTPTGFKVIVSPAA